MISNLNLDLNINLNLTGGDGQELGGWERANSVKFGSSFELQLFELQPVVTVRNWAGGSAPMASSSSPGCATLRPDGAWAGSSCANQFGNNVCQVCMRN
jgi:hypothetical protein